VCRTEGLDAVEKKLPFAGKKYHHHILAAFLAIGYGFDNLTSPKRTATVTVREQNALKKIAEPEKEREEDR
jgi:hypothetical protein